MNPTNRTLMFAGVAVASAAIAFVANSLSTPETVDGFADVGESFFPDFTDVGRATALKVTDYDSDERESRSFAVEQNDNGLWVIPSHHNYPAEAADRLARTATSLMGIKKTAVTSRSKEDWKRFGVIEPDADGSAEDDERGTRLTLSDNSGNALVDLIIGNQVPDQTNQYYVRVPEKNTTYIAELDVDLSAKFSDWIEPDLLKITTTDLVSIMLDNYSIDETRGTIDLGEELNFVKEDLKSSGSWTLADLKESEEFDASPVTSLASNLDQLKIVGVRPKPEGLQDNMRINPLVKQILQQNMGRLGYFFGPDRSGDGDGERLYSNEGELLAGTDKGVQYTLYFGEIAQGSGKDIEVGLADEGKNDDSADGDEADNESPESATEDGPRRYLMVKVDFDESLLGPKPTAPEEPVMPEILKEAKEKDPESATKSEADGDSTPAKTEEDEEEATAVGEQADDKPETTKTDQEGKAAEDSAEAAGEDSKESANADAAQEGEAKKDSNAKTSDEASDDKAAKEEAKPDPKAEAQQQYDAAMADYKTQKAKYDTDLKAWQTKAEEGQEKVEELSQRFSGWYYVISSESFEKFRLSRKDVVSEKADEPEGSTGEAGKGEAGSDPAK